MHSCSHIMPLQSDMTFHIPSWLFTFSPAFTAQGAQTALNDLKSQAKEYRSYSHYFEIILDRKISL